MKAKFLFAFFGLILLFGLCNKTNEEENEICTNTFLGANNYESLKVKTIPTFTDKGVIEKVCVDNPNLTVTYDIPTLELKNIGKSLSSTSYLYKLLEEPTKDNLGVGEYSILIEDQTFVFQIVLQKVTIEDIYINTNGHLIVEYIDTSTMDYGKIVNNKNEVLSIAKKGMKGDRYIYNIVYSNGTNSEFIIENGVLGTIEAEPKDLTIGKLIIIYACIGGVFVLAISGVISYLRFIKKED